MKPELQQAVDEVCALPLPRAQGDRYDVEELTAIVEMLRASGVKSFQYKDLQLSFDGAGKTGGTETALRNPALKRLLGGGP